MKILISASMLISALLLTSCGKAKELPNFYPTETKKIDPVVGKKSGFKCNLSGESENKEVFLQITKKEDKTTVSFYDFTSATKISILAATFEGFTLMSFNVSEDNKVLQGEGLLMHSNLSSLSDEGKVLSATGKLTINEDISGLLEQKLFISKEDNSIETTDLKEVAKIENCEAFEATQF